MQGGQNFFEKIRTFSEEIRTINTIFEKKNPYNPYNIQEKKSVQSVHILEKIRKIFEKIHTISRIFYFLTTYIVIHDCHP